MGSKKFNVDEKRMALVEEKKKKRLMFFGIMFSSFVFLICIGTSFFIEKSVVDLPPAIVKGEYEWQIHGSEAALKRVEIYQDSLGQSGLVLD